LGAEFAGIRSSGFGERMAQLGAAALLVLGLVGCGRDDVATYRAPKDQPASPPPAAMAAPGDAAAPAVPKITWTLPADWKELPAGEMRVGYFAVSDANNHKAEITVIPLPGAAGGDLSNLNRWRGQVGLGPVSEEEMAKLTEAVQIGDQSGKLFDLAGATPGQPGNKRMLAAVQYRDGMAWFFKMNGDDALVAAQKPAFVQFLKQVHFEAAGSPAPPPTASAPPLAPAPDLAAADNSGRPKWSTPPTWQEQKPGPMQMAKYLAPSAAGKAEVTVSMLPGAAGGLLPNVNRWRGQIGLPPVAESELPGMLTRLELSGAEGVVVDMTASQSKRRLVAGIVTVADNKWFYKLMGDDAAVAQERPAFLTFVQSAKYGP